MTTDQVRGRELMQIEARLKCCLSVFSSLSEPIAVVYHSARDAGKASFCHNCCRGIKRSFKVRLPSLFSCPFQTPRQQLRQRYPVWSQGFRWSWSLYTPRKRAPISAVMGVVSSFFSQHGYALLVAKTNHSKTRPIIRQSKKWSSVLSLASELPLIN